MTTGERKVPVPKGAPIELARALVPLLTEYDQEIDETRRVPDHVMDRVKETGLPWMMLPKRIGGAGELMRTEIAVTAELGRGSPGAAWSFGLLCAVTAAAGSLPAAAVDRIFRTGRELVCGVTIPAGVATPTEGGYIVTGAWPYASGSQFADWGMSGLRIMDADGKFAGIGYAFMPFGEGGLTLKDTWHVIGMRGSASNTIVANELFVPAELVQLNGYRQLAPQQQLSEEPRDNWSSAGAFPLGVLAPLLGAARKMLDIMVGDLDTRGVSMWDYPRMSASQSVLQQVGEAAIEIDSAWLHVMNAADILDVNAQDHPITQDEVVRLQADCGYAMQLLRRAAGRLMDLGGASAFTTDHPLQRAWRDIAIGSRHAALNSLQSMEMYGRKLAGQPLQNPAFRAGYE